MLQKKKFKHEVSKSSEKRTNLSNTTSGRSSLFLLWDFASCIRKSWSPLAVHGKVKPVVSQDICRVLLFQVNT